MDMSLPMNSLYSLTWGDYGTSLVSAVQLLRCHGDLVDCTLAAGGRSFPAHKIVLCAASPFLMDLLKVSDSAFSVCQSHQSIIPFLCTVWKVFVRSIRYEFGIAIEIMFQLLH